MTFNEHKKIMEALNKEERALQESHADKAAIGAFYERKNQEALTFMQDAVKNKFEQTPQMFVSYYEADDLGGDYFAGDQINIEDESDQSFSFTIQASNIAHIANIDKDLLYSFINTQIHETLGKFWSNTTYDDYGEIEEDEWGYGYESTAPFSERLKEEPARAGHYNAILPDNHPLKVTEQSLQLWYNEVFLPQVKNANTIDEYFQILSNSMPVDSEAISLTIDEEKNLRISYRYDYNIEATTNGEDLVRIINAINEKESQRIHKELENIAKQGMGEIRRCSSLKMPAQEDIDGTIYGRIDENTVLYRHPENGLSIGKKHYLISTDHPDRDNYYIFKDTSRTESCKIPLPQMLECQTHPCTHDKIYYKQKVYDFQVNGEQYHVKSASRMSSSGIMDHNYTVAWKGDEQDDPKIALGFSTSHLYISGPSEEYVIGLITANPERFAQYYEQYAGCRDSRGTFPTQIVEDAEKELLSMPKESMLASPLAPILEEYAILKTNFERHPLDMPREDTQKMMELRNFLNTALLQESEDTRSQLVEALIAKVSKHLIGNQTYDLKVEFTNIQDLSQKFKAQQIESSELC